MAVSVEFPAPKGLLGSSDITIQRKTGLVNSESTFDSAKYQTERDVRKSVEGQLSALNAGTLGGKVAATMGTVIDRYIKEEFPSLRHSTQTTNKSLINLHIRPRWQDVRIPRGIWKGVGALDRRAGTDDAAR